MPHQCTNCGHTFPDGSKEMLSGCPDCGGNKFQFKPAGASTDQSNANQPTKSQSTTDQSTTDQSTTDQPTPGQSATNQSTQTQSTTKPTTDRSSQSPPETEGVSDDSGFVSKDPKDPGESPAQSSARSDVVSPSELTAAGKPSTQSDETTTADSAPKQPADQGEPATEPPENPSKATGESTASPETTDSAADGEQSPPESSNLDQLRQELNDQFESIRIVSPGQYELNLMELYDRDEYIISLREDGRYVIEVPDGWGDSDDA